MDSGKDLTLSSMIVGYIALNIKAWCYTVVAVYVLGPGIASSVVTTHPSRRRLRWNVEAVTPLPLGHLPLISAFANQLPVYTRVYHPFVRWKILYFCK